MYCIYCGKEIKEGYEFCPECGKPLVDPEALNEKLQKLEQEKKDAISDKDRIICENRGISVELKKVKSEKDEITEENKKIISELKEVKSNRDWIAGENESLIRDLKNAKSDRDRLVKESENLANDLTNIKNERDRFANKCKERDNTYQEERAKRIEELKRKEIAFENTDKERDKAYGTAANAENKNEMFDINNGNAAAADIRSRKKMIIMFVVILIVAIGIAYFIGHAAGAGTASNSSNAKEKAETTEQSTSSSSSADKASGSQSSDDQTQTAKPDDNGVIAINTSTKKGTVLYSGKNIVVKYNRAAYDDSYDPAEYVVYLDVENNRGKTINVNPGSDSYADNNALELDNLDDNGGEIKAKRSAWVAFDFDKDELKRSDSTNFKAIKTSVSISNADFDEIANVKISLDRSLWNH